MAETDKDKTEQDKTEKDVTDTSADADAEDTTGNPEAGEQSKKEDQQGSDADADSTGDSTGDVPEGEDGADAEDTAGKDKPLDTDVWGDTGDEVGNSVLELLQNSDMSVEDAKALIYDPLTEHGDPTKLDRDALVEKVGKAKANLVMAGIENYVSKQNAKNEAILESVYEAAGGKDSWSKVAEWARANIPDADRAEYNALLDEGGVKAKFAAGEYVRLYNEDAKNTSVGKTTTLEGDTPAGDQGEAISRVEYAERMDKLHRTGKATTAAIAEVQRARERGRKKGL